MWLFGVKRWVQAGARGCWGSDRGLGPQTYEPVAWAHALIHPASTLARKLEPPLGERKQNFIPLSWGQELGGCCAQDPRPLPLLESKKTGGTTGRLPVLPSLLCPSGGRCVQGWLQ